MRYHLLNLVIPRVLPPILCALYRSCKIEVRGKEHLKAVLGPAIYAGWHGILPFILYFGSKVKMATMVSQSEDGSLIVPVFERFGFEVVRGSSGKGGAIALRQIYRFLKKGYNVGLAVDGSRGPARRVQGGTLFLAAHTGSPIIPINVVYRHSIKFNSWDKMEIPIPFSRVFILYGPPIYVKRGIGEEEFEAIRLKLERILFELYREGMREIKR